MAHRKYIYPPRPEHNFPASDLDHYDDGTYLAEPKLNGSCAVLFINGNSVKVMNRHKGVLTNMKMELSEYSKVFGTGDHVVVGEYMNKSQKDANRKTWNQKFVIFDILVYDGKYLLKTTFEERYKLLQTLYKPISENDWLYQISENIWMVKAFYTDFRKLWNELIKINMFEGLVFKRRDGKLERGARASNNTKTQLKCRKPTKNYGY